MIDWNDLSQELDNWAQQNRTVQLWWRDDDADRAFDAVRRMMQVSQAYGVPVAIAVSPAIFDLSLAHLVEKEFRCAVLQHGYAHLNHASADERKCELGDHRQANATVEELSEGLSQTGSLFGELFLPVMVPPWNRISDAVLAKVNEIGFVGISGYTPRRHSVDHGLQRCNTHVDIIDWRVGEKFIGVAPAVQLLVTHLESKRLGQAYRGEATGLLTHHLRHDEASWDFIDRFLAFTTNHSAVEWVSARTLFS